MKFNTNVVRAVVWICEENEMDTLNMNYYISISLVEKFKWKDEKKNISFYFLQKWKERKKKITEPVCILRGLFLIFSHPFQCSWIKVRNDRHQWVVEWNGIDGLNKPTTTTTRKGDNIFTNEKRKRSTQSRQMITHRQWSLPKGCIICM